MGTLFSQRARQSGLTKNKLISEGEKIKEVSNELSISFKEGVELYLAKAKIDDYDAKDEQLAGFGEILRKINKSLKHK